MVPDELQFAIYQAYEIGQCEKKKRPTVLYLTYARRAITSVKEREDNDNPT